MSISDAILAIVIGIVGIMLGIISEHYGAKRRSGVAVPTWVGRLTFLTGGIIFLLIGLCALLRN